MWNATEKKDKHKTALGNSRSTRHFSNSYFKLLSLWAQLIKINNCICFGWEFRPSLNSTKAFVHRFTNYKVNNFKLARHTVNIVLAI